MRALIFFRIIHALSHNFRSASRIVRAPLKLPVKSGHVLIKIIYAGVNASDVSSLVVTLMICIIAFDHCSVKCKLS